MKKIIINSINLFFLIYLMGCSGPNPEEELTPEEKDVYVTNYDPSINFADYRTFTITDSVRVIQNDREVKTERSLTDENLLNAIKEEMQNLGYVFIEGEGADVGLSVSKISYAYTGVGVDYNNYGFYDPYSWGYGGYGYSFPTYYTYQVRQGTVLVDMVDLKNPSNNNKLKVIWNGQMIDGLGRLASEERIVKGVRGLFAQSPYLKDGK